MVVIVAVVVVVVISSSNNNEVEAKNQINPIFNLPPKNNFGQIEKHLDAERDAQVKEEAESVVAIDASVRPFKVKTNMSVIETHAIIVMTGAESNWLNVPGEHELQGGAV